MNKAIYIIGIVFAFIFIGICGYYAEEVSSARFNALFSSYNYSDYSYGGYSSYDSSSSDLTMEAGLWSLFFILFFITMNLIGLIKVKTRTSKVISIIGLSFSAIILFWDFAVMASPGAMSFDEVSPAWIFFALTMLAFAIVGLIQSVRYANRSSNTRGTVKTVSADSSDLLDS